MRCWPRNGARSAPSAASSAARSNSSAGRRKIGSRSRPRPIVHARRRRSVCRAWSVLISPRSASPPPRPWWNGEGPAEAFSARRRAGRRRRAEACRGQYSARWNSPQGRSAPTRNTRTSPRRTTSRRCATRCGKRRSNVLRAYLWGPFTRFGCRGGDRRRDRSRLLNVWLDRGIVHLGPFFDFVLTWNTGISYRLFPQEATWPLRAAGAESRRRSGAVGVAGAGGTPAHRMPRSALDRRRGDRKRHRPAYGAVADFVLFHITTPSFNFAVRV